MQTSPLVAVVMSTVAVKLTGQLSYLVRLLFYWPLCVFLAKPRLWIPATFTPPIPSLPFPLSFPSQNSLLLLFPSALFVSPERPTKKKKQKLKAHLCCVTLKAMKMSRRSADASQRALAYSRMVDGLNEFRLAGSSHSLTMTQTIISLDLCFPFFFFTLHKQS